MHTHTQMHAHMLTSLQHVYTNTYFPLRYLRISEIVHTQHRLNKHVEQKNKQGVGVVLLNKH